MIKIWQVWDGDYDGNWVVASFDSEDLAKAYADTFGLHRVEAEDVLSSLPPEATDPTLRAEREAARKAAHDQAIAWERKRSEHERLTSEWRDSITIDQVGPRPKLCHCRTFSSDTWFVSQHGYCGYCGGWTPETLREARGESVLVDEIDKLAIHDRVKMRALCGLPNNENA